MGFKKPVYLYSIAIISILTTLSNLNTSVCSQLYFEIIRNSKVSSCLPGLLNVYLHHLVLNDIFFINIILQISLRGFVWILTLSIMGKFPVSYNQVIINHFVNGNSAMSLFVNQCFRLNCTRWDIFFILELLFFFACSSNDRIDPPRHFF